MTVQLDSNGHPVSWGDSIEGKDIPDPPATLTEDPYKRAMWDGSQWVEDTNWSSPYTVDEWVADRKNGNFASDTEALDKLADALSGVQ